MPFRDVVERFRLYPPPQRPSVDEIWIDGKRVDKRDYFFYSRLHFPSFHLSGLATTRVSSTLQAQLAFTHQPTMARLRFTPRGEVAPKASSAHPPGNLLLSLQHDTGQYSGEYTYSASDGMFGVRGLYNFGWQDEEAKKEAKAAEAEGNSNRVDEDEDMLEGGLRGRFSAGGEVYLSLKQRSLGGQLRCRLAQLTSVSIGGRFTTLPPNSNPHAPPSPPTTITILYNPLMGFISTAYAAQLSPTVSLATRFGVNIYSYESDFSVGGEWWIGRRFGGGRGPAVEPTPEELEAIAKRAKLGGSLRDDPGPDAEPELVDIAEKAMRQVGAARLKAEKERDGVLKASLRGDWSLALLYESRIRNCLVSVGLVSDVFSGTSRAIRGVGLEVQYYS